MQPLRRLDARDAGFLHSETAHAHANISVVQIYDQATAPGGLVRFKTILSHIASRLHRSPVFRSKLQRVPMALSPPAWVEDEHFDLEYHVRHIALPKPGDWRQFCIQASRIHARALDLNRPLWEIYVIEGLDSFADLPPGSFALLTKVHRAAIDPAQRNELLDVLHDTTVSAPAPAPPEPWFPQRPPGTLSQALRGATQTLLSPSKLMAPLMRAVPAALAFAGDLLKWPEHQNATRFNSVVSPHRVFDTRRFLVDEFRRIAALVPGATVDDAIVAVCAGGLRRYLELHGELPGGDLTGLAPPPQRSGRTEPIRLRLGTDTDDPVRRLAVLHRQTAAATPHGKAQARPLQRTGVEADTALAAGRALGSRLLGHAGLGRELAPVAFTLSPVKGPDEPWYLAGARMTYLSALLPIRDGQGLVFAVTVYDGRVVISPTSCRELMPDPQAFTQCVRDSFQEMLALAGPSPRPAAGTQVVKPPRPRASASGTRSPARRSARKAATSPAAAPAVRPRSTAPRR
jgi:diacylglycerol O-acyltransferase / wax synthase